MSGIKTSESRESQSADLVRAAPSPAEVSGSSRSLKRRSGSYRYNSAHPAPYLSDQLMGTTIAQTYRFR